MEVEHQPARHRFVVRTDALESVLEYQRVGDSGVNFTRTFVPEALRGRGIAERLVRTALRWARTEQLQMHADCWYVRRFLDRGQGG